MWVTLIVLALWASEPPAPHVTALFFITHDCPIANSYAPQIRSLCDEYAKRGLACKLVYADPSLTADRLRKHQQDYSLTTIPAVIDTEHQLIHAYRPKVTPEAVVLSEGKVVYRGRIDDRWVGWGQKRQQASREDLRQALNRALAGNRNLVETKAVGCWIADLANLKAGERTASPPATR